MLTKMMANVAKAPSEPKYRKVRLSNPKVAEGLVHVPGVRQFLVALGWRLVSFAATLKQHQQGPHPSLP